MHFGFSLDDFHSYALLSLLAWGTRVAWFDALQMMTKEKDWKRIEKSVNQWATVDLVVSGLLSDSKAAVEEEIVAFGFWASLSTRRAIGIF